MEPSVDVVKAAKGSLGLLVQGALNSFLALILFMVLARFISKTEMGVYAALLSTYEVFEILGIFGLMDTGARFVSNLFAREGMKKASAAARRIILLGAFSSLAVALGYFALSPYLSSFLLKSYEYTGLFRVASLIVLTYSFSFVVDGLMQGIREFNMLASIRILSQLVRIFSTILLLFFGYGVLAVLVGWIASSILKTGLLLLPINRQVDLTPSSSSLSFPWRMILDFALPILGYRLLLLSSYYVDMYALMMFFLPPVFGTYNVAVTASMALQNIVIAPLIAVLLPSMSRAYGKGGVESVESAFEKSTKYISMVYVPAAVGLAALSPSWIWLMAGSAYKDAALLLSIIALSSVPLGLSTPITVCLQSIGRASSVFRVTVVAFLCGGIASFLLAPIAGTIGAALGRSVLFIVTLAYGISMTKKFVKVRYDKKALSKVILASILMAALVSALQFCFYHLLMLPVYVITGAFAYFFALKALNGIDKQDLLIVERTIPKPIWRYVELFLRL